LVAWLGVCPLRWRLHALAVDALADVFRHPHPRTAAQAAVGVAGHLGEFGARGPEQLA